MVNIHDKQKNCPS